MEELGQLLGGVYVEVAKREGMERFDKLLGNKGGEISGSREAS